MEAREPIHHEDIRPDDTLNIYVTDGIITATAKKITKKEGTENDD